MNNFIKTTFILFIYTFIFSTSNLKSKLTIYHPALDKIIDIYNDDIKTLNSKNTILVKSNFIEIEITDFESKKHSILINKLIIKSELYGKINLTREYSNHSLLIDIITSPYFLRLFRINQYGLSIYGSHNKDLFKKRFYHRYTRGDHSINLAIILFNFNRSITEIVCSLLHDYTHTKGSHLGDSLLRLLIKKNYNDPIIEEIKKTISNTNEQASAIQDMIFEWYFFETGMTDILISHNINVNDILLKNNKVVKQKAPNLNGDNLEYTLTGAFLSEILTLESVKEIINALIITNEKKWTFKKDKIKTAIKFTIASIKFDSINSASPWNAIMNYYGAKLFKKAIKEKILTVDELVFAPNIDDEKIWKKIKKSNNDKVKYLVKIIENPDSIFEKTESIAKNSILIKTKTRAVDPYIKGYGLLSKLNITINNKLKKHFYEKWIKGLYIKLLKNNGEKEIIGF